MNKTFPRLALFSLALLFTIFLVLGNIFIYQKQRASYLDDFKKTQQTDIKLLSQLAREALITQNYALIEWFFNTWGLDYKKAVRLTLENQNGFALSQYQRRKAAEGDTITSTNTLTLHDGIYTITLTSDSIEIDNMLEELKLQFLLVNLGATILVIINIWFFFQRFAIRPLEHEKRLRKIAEEKLRKFES
ncbi:MAG: hypothetical protein GY744_15685 [Gammaproteobacteria bacterium]|nr:hypothetical protein [Gammaproteobacteria bacterium]